LSAISTLAPKLGHINKRAQKHMQVWSTLLQERFITLAVNRRWATVQIIKVQLRQGLATIPAPWTMDDNYVHVLHCKHSVKCFFSVVKHK
jgi:hypothetical protein